MTKGCARNSEASGHRALTKPECVITVLWLSLALVGWLWLGPIWISALRPVHDRINDFYQDWGSARNYVVGLPVYTHHARSVPRHLGLPSNPVPSIEYNAHPPTSVLLALPTAQLDYPDAVLVWNVLSLAALLASMTIVARRLSLPPTLLPPTLALTAFCHPIYGNIYQGQLTLVLMFLVTAVWALERADRPGAAGLLIGAAAAIKLFPAYLALYYVARRQWRPVLAAVLSLLALTMLTAFVLGVNTYYDYISTVLPNQAKFRSFAYNLSIAGFWHKLFDPVTETGPVEPLLFWPAMARWGTLLSDLAVTLAVAVLACRAHKPSERNFAFAAVVVAMLLVSPVTWDFSLPLLLVPIALLTHSAHTSQIRWKSAALFLILAIDWIPQNLLTKFFQAGRPLSVFPWTFMLGAPSLKFYALLGTFLLGLVAFKHEMQVSREEQRSTGNTDGHLARAGAHPAASMG
jgi:Glycosyltransferase family 87